MASAGAFHRLGRHLQTGQNLDLLASVIEGSLLTHQSVHPAHAGRGLRVFDIQFAVGRELAWVAMRAQIVRTRDLHRAQHRQYGFGADLLVSGVVATRAGRFALIR